MILESIARVGAVTFAAGLVLAAPQSLGVAQADANGSESGASASAAAGQSAPAASTAESVDNAEPGSARHATAVAESGESAAGQDSVAETVGAVPADIVEEPAAAADLAEEAAMTSDTTAVAESGDLVAGQDSVAETVGAVPADIVEEPAAAADLAEEAAMTSDTTTVAESGDLVAGQDSVAETVGAVPADIVEEPAAAADFGEEPTVAPLRQEGNERPPADPDRVSPPLRSSPATDSADVGATAAAPASEGAKTDLVWALQDPSADSPSAAVATTATSDAAASSIDSAAASSIDKGVDPTQAERSAIRIRDVLHTVVGWFLDAVSDRLSSLPANPLTDFLQAAWLSLRRNLFNHAPLAQGAHWSSKLTDDIRGPGSSGTDAAPTAKVPSTPAAAIPAYAPDEVLVTWKPGTSAIARGLAMAQAEGNVMASMSTKKMIDTEQGAVDRLKVGVGTAAAIKALSKNPAVAFVEPNYRLSSTAAVTSTNDLYYTNGSLWGMYSDDSPTVYGPSGTTNAFGSGAEEAWGQGHTGSPSVVVAVLDEGIQITHPDLAANIWTNPYETAGDGVDNDGNGYVDDVNGWDFYYGDNTVYDPGEDAHGTHVGGTIGGVGGNGIGVSGVSPNVQIIATKFLGPQGGYTSDAIAAIDYLTDLKIRHNVNLAAINNSWGGGGYSSALHSAILRAAKADILFVAAAGNSTVNTDTTANWPSNYSTLQASATEPAASYESVISVASITSTGALSWFSNYGASTVDIGAPGSAILSTVPGGYASYNGTSMAAPHVTGAIALLKSFNPTSTAADLRTAILSNARATTSLTGKTVTGGTLSMEGLFTVTPPPNTAPVAVADGPFTVTAGESLTLTHAQLVGNDIDPDLVNGDSLAVHRVWAPIGREVSSDGGTVTFTPPADSFGPTRFAYWVRDSAGAVSATHAWVTVTVPPPWEPNTAPVAVADGPFTVTAGESLTLTHAQLVGNDIDPDLVNGDSLAVHGVWAPIGREVSSDGGTVTFTPAADSFGPTRFAYWVRDSAGAVSAPAWVTVTVPPPWEPNTAPVAVADGPFTVTAGESLTLTHAQLVGNDIDPDLVNGDSLAVHRVWAPIGREVSSDGGTVTFTPAADSFGPTRFAYWVRDSAGAVSAPAWVTVTVPPPWEPNTAPVAVADGPFTVTAGESLTLTHAQLVGNDIDPDLVNGDSLAVHGVWAPIGREVSSDGGTVTFTPAADSFGPTRFAYWVRDSAGAVSAPAWVTVTVPPPNTAPVAVADGPFTVTAGESLTLTHAQLVGNDIDPDLVNGDSLAVHGVWAPIGREVSSDGGTVTFTPPADSFGPTRFAYWVRDSAGAVSATPAWVTVTVPPPWEPNTAPVAVADGPFTVTAGESLTLTHAQLVGNDIDPDLVNGDSLAVHGVWAPIGREVSSDGGTVTFTPAADSFGPTRFAYWVRDSAGAVSAPAWVTVTVPPPWEPNTAPVAVADGPFTVTAGESLTLTHAQLVGNDIDPDLVNGDSLAVHGVWAPIGREVSSDGGTVTFTPAADSFGPTRFAYWVRDSAGAVSAPAWVTVTASPRPAPGIYTTPFAPLATTGTPVRNCDDCTSGLVPIGFTFRFFDTDYTQINISSNGFVGFSPTMDDGCCSGEPIPSTDILGGVIAAAWTDLNPEDSPLAPNSVTYETRGAAANRILVVSFNQVPCYGAGCLPLTTQIVLHETTNVIEIFTTTQQGGWYTWSQGAISPNGLTGYSLPGRSAQTYSLANDAVIIYTN